jgi:hypothetical protein
MSSHCQSIVNDESSGSALLRRKATRALNLLHPPDVAQDLAPRPDCKPRLQHRPIDSNQRLLRVELPQEPTLDV